MQTDWLMDGVLAHEIKSICHRTISSGKLIFKCVLLIMGFIKVHKLKELLVFLSSSCVLVLVSAFGKILPATYKKCLVIILKVCTDDPPG